MNSLESDLHKSETIIKKIKDDRYAQNLYSALCNNSYKKSEDTESWSCSWRYAAGIVADIRRINYQHQEGYLDWYLSGSVYDLEGHVYVLEGVVTEEILQDLTNLGWKVE